MLPSPSSYCSPQDRPIIQRLGIGAKNSDFIRKPSRPRRCRASVPNNPITPIRIQSSFILTGERV